MCESNHLTRGNLRRERDRGRVKDKSLSSKYKLLRCLTTHFEFRITTIRAVPLATTHIRIRAHSSGLLVFNTFFSKSSAVNTCVGCRYRKSRMEWIETCKSMYVLAKRNLSTWLRIHKAYTYNTQPFIYLFIYAFAWKCACSIAQWNKSKSSVLYKNKFHLHQLETMLSRSGY